MAERTLTQGFLFFCVFFLVHIYIIFPQLAHGLMHVGMWMFMQLGNGLK